MTQQDPAKLEQPQRSLRHDRAGEDVAKNTTLDQDTRRFVHFSVEHLHGPEEIEYGEEELVVVCLVRDGRPYIRSFVEHYTTMGLKHLVFLDNGSTDGTVEALKKYQNVTVLRTGLPYKRYQWTMQQYLIERFGWGRWSLYVDIDELFDYPYSDVVSLGSLLKYLNDNSYTAVVAQMLDMFPEEPLSDVPSDEEEEDEPLKERHRFYDISNIRRQNYGEDPFVSGTGNVLANEEIEVYRNGIQHSVLGNFPQLTKHPLIFLNDEVKPLVSSHSIGDARVADITCALFHYKFTNHLYELVREAVRQENYMRDSRKQKKWHEVLQKNPKLLVKRETSREIRSVNDLVENGFLVVSEGYMSWVDAEEEKRLARTVKAETGSLSEAKAKLQALK